MPNGYVVICSSRKRMVELYKRLVEYLGTKDVRCRILPNIHVIDIIGCITIRFSSYSDPQLHARVQGFHGPIVTEHDVEKYLDEEEKK